MLPILPCARGHRTISRAVGRRAGIQNQQGQSGDASHLSLYGAADRGARLHLLRGIQSLQGTRAHHPAHRHRAQRGQGDRHCQDHYHHRHKDRWDGWDRATDFVSHRRAANHQATLRPKETLKPIWVTHRRSQEENTNPQYPAL